MRARPGLLAQRVEHLVKVHRILSRALKIAHRRIVGENVATLVDPPSIDETEANPFTKEEAKAFLEAAAKRPTFMRWIVGAGMGFRQGETLGLRWPYVDLEAELFRPEWQLQRLTWRHGCDDPRACGARLHRFEPCPPDCTTHRNYKRGCPKPCPKTCARHASACPQRKERVTPVEGRDAAHGRVLRTRSPGPRSGPH